ncbi:hypothetical protein N665_0104s0345 [Sinapis alba]|nr:hypothetical protein N665_0104s0345 [Sinapis alba]
MAFSPSVNVRWEIRIKNLRESNRRKSSSSASSFYANTLTV